jgi:hypothetical protein
MAQPVWTTPAGSLGSFPSLVSITLQLVANPVLPATSLTYALISGSLPTGLSISNTGEITGIPSLVVYPITEGFTIRVTDNLGNIRDRSFSITISGVVVPQFTTPSGSLLSTLDSLWVEFPISYSNPYTENPISIQVTQGGLPPGLEINELGMIRGYPQPPLNNITLSLITTTGTQTVSASNSIICTNTGSFEIGRPVIFTGTAFGGLIEGATYYVKQIINTNEFTVSATENGTVIPLSDATGSMTVTLPSVSVGSPTIRTYSFTLTIYSPLGSSSNDYSITVINQNTPVSQGGPGNPPNTRTPTILNTRPLTFNINDTNPYYGYYIVPPSLSTTYTYPPSTNAPIGTIVSDNYFSFKIIGYDFDGNDLSYSFASLPSGFTGDTSTGWIIGNPILANPGISTFNFNVRVYKSGNPTITTQNFYFQLNVSNEITGIIAWLTPIDIGTIYNGTISNLLVEASCDTPLQYRLVAGSLPPNLNLLSTGEIIGKVADQPLDTLLEQEDTSTFNFTVEAFSPSFSVVSSTRNFTLNVLQEFGQPTDTLYIKCTPDIQDRQLIESLLTNTTIIPDNVLYRPLDPNFGKATDVIYEHAYGIYASNIEEYIAAVTRNHYWRRITLGEIKTAVAKDNDGNIIYEVVYSEVIDNLVNPQGVSVQESIYWPNPINLNLGPWFTSITNIYTSYVNVLGQDYYTSLTPGQARILYPNSLYNMRTRVAQELGQEYNFNLYPLWMTSQQEDGNTLGFTPAWVICYTKPGFSEIVKNNINNLWNGTLNLINFKIDRFTVDKSLTYNYDKYLVPPTWTDLPSATPVPNPSDSQDFYVLFPRKTILPDETQY